MEHLRRCPLCKNTQRKEIMKLEYADKYLNLYDKYLNTVPRSYYQCKECNFIYLSPAIIDNEIKVIYEEYRRQKFRRITPEAYFDKLTTLPKDKSEACQKAKYVSDNVGEINSVLDIGCGGGIITFRLQKEFPNARMEAVEPNEEYAQLVRKKLHIKVYTDFYKLGLVKNKFDLVLMSDVLEHIKNIKDTCKTLRTNVKPNKFLFIAVPSQKNFELYEKIDEVFNACHLYYFNEKNIRFLLEKEGFKLIKKDERKETGIKDFYIFKNIGRG